jgi:DNA mismatch repair protein MSH4
VALPPAVLEVATEVSTKLAQQIDRRKKSSRAFALARRRKLILNLKETLVQARDGPMEGAALTSWLRKLQEEFVLRMTAIDTESADVDTELGENGSEIGKSGEDIREEDEQQSEDIYGSSPAGEEAEDENEVMTNPDDEICFVPVASST